MPSPSPNLLLAALPHADYAQLGLSLEAVSMRLGDMIHAPGTTPQHAYFPTTAVVSLHCLTASGASVEASGVGREGVVGISVFMGGGTTPSSAVVQTAGQGYRVESRELVRAFDGSGALRGLLLRYVQALMTQIAQTAACYRHHAVEQQLARWLLQTVDRVPAGSPVTTQALAASVLGVRRESLAEAAGRLQEAGYIRYRRGHISIVDPVGLRTSACECHRTVERELQRLLPGTRAGAGDLPR